MHAGCSLTLEFVGLALAGKGSGVTPQIYNAPADRFPAESISALAGVLLKRRITQNRRAVHHSALRPVIVDRVMLSHAVVPHGHVVCLPTPAQGEFRSRAVGEQQFQNGLTLGSFQFIDPRGEPSLTNNALRPLTGCVRMTGCDSGGFFRRVSSQRARSSVVLPNRSKVHVCSTAPKAQNKKHCSARQFI